jgi:hypothetical protein
MERAKCHEKIETFQKEVQKREMSREERPTTRRCHKGKNEVKLRRKAGY